MENAHRLLVRASLVLAFGLAASGCRGKSPPAPKADPNQLVIVKATWGARHKGAPKDVTKDVAELVKDNALKVPAATAFFGDPADLEIKQLRVTWSKGGVVAEKHATEGETLVIGATEKPVRVRTVITKAIYGNLQSGKTTDVTLRVADMVKDNALSLTPNNTLFGDPAPIQLKQLQVDYTVDGKPFSKTVSENETLTISPGGQ